MARKRVIRPEERVLWRQVARSVRPISPDRLRALEEEPEAGDADVPERPSSDPSGPQSGRPPPAIRSPRDPVFAPPPGPADRSAERRVRRGRLEIEARIDLHGLTQEQALSSLRHFLSMAYREGYRTVLVITGKGYKPRGRDTAPWEPVEEPGVLRRKLPEWLAFPDIQPLVSGYAPAHARHGGHGAFYVTLRTRTKL